MGRKAFLPIWQHAAGSSTVMEDKEGTRLIGMFQTFARLRLAPRLRRRQEGEDDLDRSTPLELLGTKCPPLLLLSCYSV